MICSGSAPGLLIDCATIATSYWTYGATLATHWIRIAKNKSVAKVQTKFKCAMIKNLCYILVCVNNFMLHGVAKLLLA